MKGSGFGLRYKGLGLGLELGFRVAGLRFVGYDFWVTALGFHANPS
jgi:hypothetical protein